MTRRVLLIALLFAAGCESVRGPFAPRSPVRVDDPRLTIREQESLGRARVGLPDYSWVLPQGAGARER